MKFLAFLFITISFTLSCKDAQKEPDELTLENARLQKEIDSLKNLQSPQSLPDVDSNGAAPVDKPSDNIKDKGGFHPISLHWISWDKLGRVRLDPLAEGWFSIKGGQENADSYLKIKGKIRRVSEKELEFDGIIETKHPSNYGGKPCLKKGKQTFFAKGNRTYFRLQNMLNCEGNMLVDYIDIYPGSSAL